MFYYIVYLIKPQKYAVIPFHWLRDGDSSILEKFVNNGLNSNQTHLCYYSRRVGAVQDAAHVPNFNVNVSSQFPCNDDDACYRCFVLKFKGECRYFFILWRNHDAVFDVQIHFAGARTVP